MGVKITDKDNGYRKILKLLTSGKKPVVQVGVFGEKAAEGHKDSELSVGEIATIHEFGLGVPERSFVRGWCDENQSQVETFLKKQCEAAIKDKADNFDPILERLGMYCVGGMQNRIGSGILPELKDTTVKRKGSSVPLIDTGQLRSSITYKVNPSGS